MSFWQKERYYQLRGWRSYLKGDFLDALQYMEAALRFSSQVGVAQTALGSHFGCALALHQLKRDGEAIDHIGECYAIARSNHVPVGEFLGIIAEAKLALDKRDDSAGLISLRKAMSIGRENGLVHVTFGMIQPIMADLCLRALEEGIEVEYAISLIGQLNLMPDPPPIDCTRWPWRLKIFTMGRFEIVRDGEKVQFSGKVQKRPLELLKLLISNGGTDLSEEYIADSLWPDSDGDKAHIAFTAALFRLRRLIGVEKAVRFQNGKASLDRRYCWVDSIAFERICAQLDRGAPDSLLITLIEKAVGIYEGHFLPADDNLFWTASCRERLRSRFLRLMLMEGARLENSMEWENATGFYERALHIDNLSEELYERLMICHKRLGRDADATEVYNRCKRVLLSGLGIEPSRKLKEILRDKKVPRIN